MTLPKYAKYEVERRWLVEPKAIESLAVGPYREIEDTYVQGTGMRLRKVREAGAQAVFKLCKKYGKSSALSEAVVNLYLSEAEYMLLRSKLGGKPVKKIRYAIAGGSLDLYEGDAPIAVFEIEFDSEDEAMSYAPPAFVGVEITARPSFSGAALAERIA